MWNGRLYTIAQSAVRSAADDDLVQPGRKSGVVGSAHPTCRRDATGRRTTAANAGTKALSARLAGSCFPPELITSRNSGLSGKEPLASNTGMVRPY